MSFTYSQIINNISHSGSTQLLVKLFGGQIYNIFNLSSGYSGPQQTLLTIFGSLTSGIAIWMFIFIAIYFIMTGVLNQSQSGEFMLKSWNGVWPILRLGFGVSAAIPFPGTNLVLMQALVIAISMLSSSIADLTWGEVLSQATKAGIVAQQNLTPLVDTAKTDAYLQDAYAYSSCAANEITYGLPDQKLSIGGFNPVNPGEDPESQSIASTCSSEKFQAFLASANSLSPPTRPDLTPEQGSDLISNDTQAKFNTYRKQQYDYLTTTTIIDYVQNRVWPFVTSNLDDLNQGVNLNYIAKQWKSLTEEFNKTLQHKIQSAVNSDKEMSAKVFTDQASIYGWISAGNYYRQLAQEQQIISNAISSALENKPGYIPLSRQSDLTASDSITDFGDENSKTLMEKAGVLSTHAAGYIADPLGLQLLKSDETTDPILAMTSFGQKLEGAAESFFVASQIPALFSWIPFAGKAFKVALANGFIELLIGATAFGGLILGTVLPCLPWIMFMFAVLSWLIHVAEMFIAAPFWVVANALPDGNTVVSSVAKKGANNILFITLFPVLSIGGLIASLAISRIGMGLFNQFSYAGFKSILGFGTFPLAFLGCLLIYVFGCWSIILSSLGLIQQFPRTILNWISLSEPGLSPFSNSHEGVVQVFTGGTLANAGSAVMNTISNSENKRVIGQNKTINERRLKKL